MKMIFFKAGSIKDLCEFSKKIKVSKFFSNFLHKIFFQKIQKKKFNSSLLEFDIPCCSILISQTLSPKKKKSKRKKIREFFHTLSSRKKKSRICAVKIIFQSVVLKIFSGGYLSKLIIKI